jgi:DNA polymerase-1
MKILLIDGLNIFIRNYVVVPSMDSNGEPIGGITGFVKMLTAKMREFSPDHAIVAWDGEGGSRWRRGIFSEYKQGRKVRLNREYGGESLDRSRDNMIRQLKDLRSLLSKSGANQSCAQDTEADDAIAYLSRFVYSNDTKLIVTSDRDFLQLVDEKTTVYSPTKKLDWDQGKVLSETGILPENFIYLKAIVGDSSDNVQGVSGVGERGVSKLFPFLGERPSSLDEILRFAESKATGMDKYRRVLDARDSVEKNVRLMQLSSPIISPQSAKLIRDQAAAKSNYDSTGIRMYLSLSGIESIDPDFFAQIKALDQRKNRLANH